MLLRNRAPGVIEPRTPSPASGFRHIDQSALVVLRWLVDNRVDFVLLGPVARAIRGDSHERGPVAIAPAPYGRNLDRLARTLNSVQARERLEPDGWDPFSDTFATKVTADKFIGPQRWGFRCDDYDVDVEGRPDGVPRYQELLYEANRFEIAVGLTIEVASPEDIELYGHIRRTGKAPEITIRRASPQPHE